MDINLLPDIKYNPITHNSRVICIDSKLLLIFTSFDNNKGIILKFKNVGYISHTPYPSSVEDYSSKILIEMGVLYERLNSELLDSSLLGNLKSVNNLKHYLAPVFLDYRLDIIANSFEIINQDFEVY